MYNIACGMGMYGHYNSDGLADFVNTRGTVGTGLSVAVAKVIHGRGVELPSHEQLISTPKSN